MQKFTSILTEILPLMNSNKKIITTEMFYYRVLFAHKCLFFPSITVLMLEHTFSSSNFIVQIHNVRLISVLSALYSSVRVVLFLLFIYWHTVFQYVLLPFAAVYGKAIGGGIFFTLVDSIRTLHESMKLQIDLVWHPLFGRAIMFMVLTSQFSWHFQFYCFAENTHKFSSFHTNWI